MKKILKASILALSVLLAAGCASSPSGNSGAEPDWLLNYRSAFPREKYIVQKGEGSKRDEAISDATAQIARYIQSEVDSRLSSSIKQMVTGEGADAVASQEISTEERTEINSTVTLLNLESESYFVKSEKVWQAVAFIEREEAWKRFEPQVQDSLVSFNAAFKKATAEDEPFIANIYYRSAWEAGKILLEKLEYARVISEEKESAFSSARADVASIPARILENTLESSISLSVSGDNGGIIETAVRSTFSDLGLTVGEANGRYNLSVVISDNQTGSADTIFKIYPDVKISMVGKSGKTIYSYQLKWNEPNGKAAGSIERAERLAFPALAERIKSEVPADFRSKMGMK